MHTPAKKGGWMGEVTERLPGTVNKNFVKINVIGTRR